MLKKFGITFVLVFSIVVMSVGIQAPAPRIAEAAPLAVVYSFSNTTSLAVPGAGTSGPASLYPSPIVVSGIPVAQAVLDVQVTLHNVSHTWTEDIDVLLVGPGGQSLAVMSDVCSNQTTSGLTFTFSDSAAAPLPSTATCISGTYRPSNYFGDDTYPAPAPAPPPTGTTFAQFNGVDPNGTWNLYVVDDAGLDTGSIAGGWTLDITTEDPAPGPEPEPAVPAVNFPNRGEILISASAPVVPYAAPGEYAQAFTLPADYDRNGFDTYVITATATVGGATWYAIWVGGVDYLWVPASQVQTLR